MAHETIDISALIGPARPEYGSNKLSAVALKSHKGHIAILAIIVVEQTELLRDVDIRVKVVKVNDYLSGSLLIRVHEVTYEQFAQIIEFLMLFQVHTIISVLNICNDTSMHFRIATIHVNLMKSSVGIAFLTTVAIA